jgi:hypothetical protein
MFDIVIMDMGGHTSNVEYLRDQLPHAKIINWTDHLSTIRRGARNIRTRYFWVLSSCCDYTDFDFLWEPAPWQSHQIHCWPSGTQQFGDTFLIPTAHWNQQQESLIRLEQYQDVNFEHESVVRLPWQIVQYNSDTLVDAISSSECYTPYVLFENKNNPAPIQADPWLWRERPVVGLTSNQATSLIPRDAHGSIREQLYDYKYLEKKKLNPGQLLDIVFIDNGESAAESNYQHLKWAAERANPVKIHRSSGVNGRVAAYRAAAELSTTPWFFAVFAKLEVDNGFDWTWQPDYWQQPKHYIFHAENPVNGLVYGHQAMIAYNRKLVLENTAPGLDFTLDQAHEVVPIISGKTYYDMDNWTCWRTAFRECIKLKHSLPNVENSWRLSQWLTVDRTAQKWSQKGAEDAIEYYNSVEGDFAELKKSYDWDWLASYALIKRNLTPSQ